MNRQYGAVSGVAMALIVLNHAVHFTVLVSPVHGGWLDVAVVLQALGVFAVPSFLFVSGAFLSYAASQVTFAFLRNSVERILWPYCVWSTVFLLVTVPAAGAVEFIAALGRNLLIGYPYHFVPLLLCWYIGAGILIPVARRPAAAGLMLLAVGAYQAVLLAMRFPDVFGAAASSWLGFARPPALFVPLSDWAIYFPLGLAVSLHGARLKPLLRRARWVFALAAGVLFLLGIMNVFGLLHAPWARFAAPLPLMLALPTLDRGSIPLVRFFEFLGRRSYGIYLVHFVVVSTVAAGASRLDLRGFALVVAPALLAIGLGVPVLAMEMVGRPRAGRRAYRYLFGIIPPAVSARHARGLPRLSDSTGVARAPEGT